jgi:hypothetical protein
MPGLYIAISEVTLPLARFLVFSRFDWRWVSVYNLERLVGY